MNEFASRLLGVDAWGLWFPGLFFMLSQDVLGSLFFDGLAFGLDNAFDIVMVLIVSFVAGSSLQLLGTHLSRERGKSDPLAIAFLRWLFGTHSLKSGNRGDTPLSFDNEQEAALHEGIKKSLSPSYDSDSAAINHYEAILAKANPTAFKRALDMMNAISIQRTFASGLVVLCLESIVLMLVALLGVAGPIAGLFGAVLSVHGSAVARMFSFAVACYVLARSSFALSRWIRRYRNRFICRNVACFRDEPWARLPRRSPCEGEGSPCW